MLLRLLIFIAAAYILYKLLAGDKKKKQNATVKEQEKKAAAGDMVKDPVCGAYVPVEADIRVREGDKTQCFCSYECRDKYLKQVRADQGKKPVE